MFIIGFLCGALAVLLVQLVAFACLVMKCYKRKKEKSKWEM